MFQEANDLFMTTIIFYNIIKIYFYIFEELYLLIDNFLQYIHFTYIEKIIFFLNYLFIYCKRIIFCKYNID